MNKQEKEQLISFINSTKEDLRFDSEEAARDHTKKLGGAIEEVRV